MDYNQQTCPGAGLTYRKPWGAGRHQGGTGLTYRKPFGAGIMNGNMGAMDDPRSPMGIITTVASLALPLIAQFFIIKWAVKASRRK